jgi:nicotinamide phosphoribosyltransferase
MKNLILNTDSYKLSHFLGYPKDVSHMYSYAESRGGKYPATLFIGLQAFIKEYLLRPITQEDIDEGAEFAEVHGEPFNREGWEHILNAHNGYLPLVIKAVPEGTLVDVHNILASVENTDPKVPWLTSYIETALMRIWYPITVATRIYYMKQHIKPYFERTSDSEDMSFAILDFSSRGVSSLETSEIGGLGHLVHFIGSDNIPAIMYARKNYNIPMAAFSVPATEHSIMTALSDAEDEHEAFEYLIDNMMQENGILSVVSDTYDVYAAAHKWNDRLIAKIRAKNGTLVFRPDSGEMHIVIPRLFAILDRKFGHDVNAKGFKVLRNVKILWGDGINEDSVHIPFAIAEKLGYSADSIFTGSGGGLMSADIDRDTCKFAFKASNKVQNGENIGICKDPITDPGKRSKRGRLMLMKENDKFITHHVYNPSKYLGDHLREVYRDGKLLIDESFEQIRARVK